MTIGLQNDINAQTLAQPRRRPQALPQPDENHYAYEVTISPGMVDQVQRYLDENRGVDFNDVIALALKAWFASAAIEHRLDLYTFYELKCIAMENEVEKTGLDKADLFRKLDALGMLPY
jgi:hypothetical protein